MAFMDLIKHPDGSYTVLMANNNREQQTYGVRRILSTDDGQTWQADGVIVTPKHVSAQLVSITDDLKRRFCCRK